MLPGSTAGTIVGLLPRANHEKLSVLKFAVRLASHAAELTVSYLRRESGTKYDGDGVVIVKQSNLRVTGFTRLYFY